MWQGPFGIMRPSPLFSPTRALTSLSLSLSLCYSSLWVLLWTHIVFVFHLFLYLSSLFSPSCVLNFLPIAILLSVCFGNFLAFYVSPTFLPLFRSPCSSLTCCARLCSVCFGTKPIVRYIPLASVSTTFPAYLPTCLLLVSLSSLHYRASFRVSSVWDGEESVSPLSFLSLLVPLVFPSTSSRFSLLLLFSLGAFGTQDSPCLPCIPPCVLIEPIFSYLLFLSRFNDF